MTYKLPVGIFLNMETLRTYLNSMTKAEQQAYAARAGTTIGYLRKAISKRTRLDGALCRRLHEESNGKANKAEMRPDIWPELIKKT